MNLEARELIKEIREQNVRRDARLKNRAKTDERKARRKKRDKID